VSIGCAANSPENQPCTDAGQPRRKCVALLRSAESATATGNHHIVPSRAIAGKPEVHALPGHDLVIYRQALKLNG
jgi:hypothetical protein